VRFRYRGGSRPANAAAQHRLDARPAQRRDPRRRPPPSA
jgi:hypothetical protein